VDILSERKELRVQKIKDGTVIDHITAGYALDVLRILGLTGKEGLTISVVMNVPSHKLGLKDIVKVEGKELLEEEVHKIALIAPNATINIVRDYEVLSKMKVKIPDTLVGLVKCGNPSCITNSREPIKPIFHVISMDPLLIQCHYCRRIMDRNEALLNLL